MIMTNYRHEIKYIINKNHATILKQRLALIMNIDKNSINKDNTYYIRSLYFDDLNSTAYHEKLDGVEFRKKYRIRIYNFDDKFIRLECKYKRENMTYKKQIKIDKETYYKIVNDEDIEVKENNLLKQFLLDKKNKNLIPSVIVDYKRLAYTYPVSEVRITFDTHVKSGQYNYDIFDQNYGLCSVLDDQEVVLEVKFNEILPEPIAIILSTIPSTRQAYSKFAVCRSLK